MGLNGAEALFFSISDGDTRGSQEIPFVTLFSFFFFILSHSPEFCYPLLKSSQTLQSFLGAFLFCFGISGYSFGCVSDISLGTCVFVCMQGEAIDEVLGLLKSMEQGFMEKVEKQELDIV